MRQESPELVIEKQSFGISEPVFIMGRHMTFSRKGAYSSATLRPTLGVEESGAESSYAYIDVSTK